MAWDVDSPEMHTDRVSASYTNWLANWDAIEEWSNIGHVTVCATDATSGEHYMGRTGFLGIGSSATYSDTDIYTSATSANCGCIWFDNHTKGALQLVSNGRATGIHYFSAGEVTPTAYKWSCGHAVLETQTQVSDGVETQVLVSDSVTTSGAFDLMGEFVSNTFTVVNFGYYLLSGRVLWRNLLAAEEFIHYVSIKVDNVERIVSRCWDQGKNTQVCSDVIYLTAGQAVKLYAYNNEADADYPNARVMREASFSWARLS